MKSKAVAALLSIFIPFIGCLYSAPIAAVVCGIFGALCIVAKTDPLPLMLFFIIYIVSIFRAIAGVNRYNRRLIVQARAAGASLI